MLRQRADGVVTAYQFLTCRIFIDGVMLPVRAAKEADFNRNLPLACMPRDASRTYATWLWPRNCSIQPAGDSTAVRAQACQSKRSGCTFEDQLVRSQATRPVQRVL